MKKSRSREVEKSRSREWSQESGVEESGAQDQHPHRESHRLIFNSSSAAVVPDDPFSDVQQGLNPRSKPDSGLISSCVNLDGVFPSYGGVSELTILYFGLLTPGLPGS